MTRSLRSPLSFAYGLFLFALVASVAFGLPRCSAPAGAPGGEEYLGDLACRRCHEDAYADWRGSHHDLAMAEASDSTVLGDFNDVAFESKGITSRMFRRAGRFVMRTEGPDGLPHDYPIAYTFGVFPLQQYLVAFPGGRLQCLPIAWDSREGRWFDLQPDERFATGDWMHWTRGSMTWNTMCADCHSTNLQKKYDPEADTFATTWSIIDVSCEACHGPGRAHVDYVGSPAYRRGEKIGGSLLQLTAGLSSREQVEQCARCHSFRSQRTAAFRPGDAYMDHYLPEILHPGPYHPDGQIEGEVYVYGSFLQSKMYRNNVRCTNCHNPHSLQLVAVGNALCGQCHDPRTYDREAHHFHPLATEGAQCVNCHMPGKYYMVNDFRRDHSFRVPRPDLSVRYGTPNACNQCHADRPAEWAARAVEKWYGARRAPHFADVLAPAILGDATRQPGLVRMAADTATPEIVRATAVWLLSGAGDAAGRQAVIEALQNPDPLIRATAVSACESFPAEDKLRHLIPRLSDPVRSVRQQAVYALADVPPRLIPAAAQAALADATREYEAMLNQQADFPTGRLQQGQYYHKQGNLDRAEAAYRRAAEADPYLAQPHLNLANVYYRRGNLAAAEQAFRKAIRLDSTDGEAPFSLGLLLAEQQRLEEAADLLRQAADRSPNPRYFYNWGLTLQHLNRPAEAERAYLAGLERQPATDYLLYALAVLYIQQQQPARAREVTGRLLQLDPGNPQYRDLLRAVGNGE